MDVPKFRALFRSALAPEVIDMIRNATNGNYSLGDERFKKEVEKALGVRITPENRVDRENILY
jgi:putative transposase